MPLHRKVRIRLPLTSQKKYIIRSKNVNVFSAGSAIGNISYGFTYATGNPRNGGREVQDHKELLHINSLVSEIEVEVSLLLGRVTGWLNPDPCHIRAAWRTGNAGGTVLFAGMFQGNLYVHGDCAVLWGRTGVG